MNFEDLSPEMQEKLREAKTPEEIIAAAKAGGYQLSEEELDQISGGVSWNSCPWHNTKPCTEYVTKPRNYSREQ